MNKTDKNLCPCAPYITIFIQYDKYNEGIYETHYYIPRIWLSQLEILPDSEKKNRVQVVSLRGDPRKHGEEAEK